VLIFLGVPLLAGAVHDAAGSGEMQRARFEGSRVTGGVAGGTLGATTSGFLAAYPTARLRFPFRSLFTILFSVALAIPIIGLIIPEFFIMRDLGLFDSRIGLVIFYSAMFFPIAFVSQRAFLASLPYEIEEAAIIEPAIALSIVYVGADNLLAQGGRDVRAWIALAFGFIHGFGFANVLREMDRDMGSADDIVVCASEVGVFDLPAGETVRRGRLGPGEMIVVKASLFPGSRPGPRRNAHRSRGLIRRQCA